MESLDEQKREGEERRKNEEKICIHIYVLVCGT